MEVICENCGKTMELSSYRSSVFCTACGTKIEVKRNLEEGQKIQNEEAYLKAKTNLQEAYYGRNIMKIVSAAEEVCKIVPDDFFARFLLSFCEEKRGNERYLKAFFQNYSLSSASEEEIRIALEEITATVSLHEEKCSFIDSLDEQGVDVSKYYEYVGKAKKEKQEKEDQKSLDLMQRLNLSITLVSLVLFVLATIIIGGKAAYALPLGILFLGIGHFVIKKRGFSLVSFFVSLVCTLGIYPIARFIVLFLNHTMNRHDYKIKLKEMYFYREGK